jgi:diguanylate cyclase (GGDEF)-like protein
VDTAKGTHTSCPIGEASCAVIDENRRLYEDNQRLQQALRTDTLTGLFNYRHFSEALEIEMERTQRSRTPTSLLILDIDFFKKVNDTWGHEIGNQALQHLAALLKQHTRRLDIACRYGGEEFTVILPSTPLNLALEVAERLRKAIEEAPLQLEAGTLALTASIGVESYREGMLLSSDEFVHLVDGYLYQAKQDGRNRVCGPAPKLATEVTADEKAALFS